MTTTTPPDLSKYRCREPRYIPVHIYARDRKVYPWLLVVNDGGHHFTRPLGPDLREFEKAGSGGCDLLPIDPPKREPREWTLWPGEIGEDGKGNVWETVAGEGPAIQPGETVRVREVLPEEGAPKA